MRQTERTGAARKERLDRELDEYSAAAEITLSVEQERSRTPNSRLALYSSVAGVALAGAFNTEAAIVYKTVDKTLNGNPQSFYYLTFSGTTNAKFRFRHDDGGVEFAQMKGSGTAAIVRETAGPANEVVRFLAGEKIQTTAANTWDAGNSRPLFSATSADTNTPAFGNFWDGHTGYIGVRYSNAGTHYGWIHVDAVDSSFESYHISGYGYNDTADASINAGEGEPAPVVPEPSTVALALLASGAAGLMRARRKKLLRGKRQG